MDGSGIPPAASGPLRPPGHQSSRPSRPINLHALHPSELAPEFQYMDVEGNLVIPGPGLVTPRWPQSGIPARIAEALGHDILPIPPELVETCLTPHGRLRCTRFVAVWIRIPQLSTEPYLVRMPILETATHGNIGVAGILGKCFIDYVTSGREIPQLYVPPFVPPRTNTRR